jgi:hypothetical protein
LLGSRDGTGGIHLDVVAYLAADILLGAVSREVTGFSALITCLAGSVQGATIGGRAIARDVPKLAAGIALHSLCLAIASEVVGAAALVAGSRARAASKSAASKAEATPVHRSTSAHVHARGVRAGTSKVARLATVIASAVSSTATESESWAIGLHMSEALAVVALLGFRRSRERAAVRLVSGLLAVVAESLGRGTNLRIVTNIATFVASTAG